MADGKIEKKEKYRQWYHTMDLGNGEITDGIYNHRPLLKYYGFPESLKGKRVLDVGCSDGFFSFLFEEKGAAEVVALDAPAHKSDFFPLAKKRLNSKVKRCLMDVYDISPKTLGYFDFVFCGTVLLHLADPIRALRNIRNVIRNGEFVCANPCLYIPLIGRISHLFGKKFTIALLYSGRIKDGEVWAYWIPAEDCLRAMIYRAGFDSIEKVGNFTLRGCVKNGHGKTIGKGIFPHAVFKMKVLAERAGDK